MLSKLELFPNVEIRRSSQSWPTAEASALAAAYSSTADWIWILGDDDTATPEALSHILALISTSEAEFWLLNVRLRQVIPLDYYNVEPEVMVTTPEVVWGRMGWISATTTLSAFLVKRSIIDWGVFLRFHSIQGIYSHSFSLFCMLLDRPVGVTNHFCVDRQEGDSQEIGKSLDRYQESLGRPRNFIWTTGLRKLIREASRISGIPRKILWRFEEIELIKPPGKRNDDGTPFQVLIVTTLCVYLRHLLRFEWLVLLGCRLLAAAPIVQQAPVSIKFDR